MADTLQTPPAAPPAADRLVAPPAARRYRWLTDGKLAALFISPAMAILLFLSIGPLIWLILLSFTAYSAPRDVATTGSASVTTPTSSPTRWSTAAQSRR